MRFSGLKVILVYDSLHMVHVINNKKVLKDIIIIIIVVVIVVVVIY